MNIQNIDGIELLKKLPDNSIDLILTDPPYIISRESGMNNFKKEVQKIDASGENRKTEAEWELFKQGKTYDNESKAKDNYIKYGNASGKKYGFKSKWDLVFYAKSFYDDFFKKNQKLKKYKI